MSIPFYIPYLTLSYLKKAVETDPSNAEANINYGVMLDEVHDAFFRIVSYIQSGQHAAGMKHLLQGVRLDVNEPDSYFILGVVRQKHGELKRAQSCYRYDIFFTPRVP